MRFHLGPAILNRVQLTMVFQDKKRGMSKFIDTEFQLGFLTDEVWMRGNVFAHIFNFIFRL